MSSKRDGIWTLKDLENGRSSNNGIATEGTTTGTSKAAAASNAASVGNNYKDCPPIMEIRHIPHLPHADRALDMLKRIHEEFYPIVQRRGYKVVLVSELCCCGDGDDYDLQGNRTNKRKKRISSKNILGYNSSHGGISEIRLRLRHANNHERLFAYEAVAGTMSHELAHCEIGPHSAAFYQLMDEIQQQHAVLQIKGIVADKGGFPLHSHQAHVLGGSQRNKNGPLEAALGRQRKRSMPPQRLGGNAQLSQWMPPRQAAAMAAEARRIRDEQWCQPCRVYQEDLTDVSNIENSNNNENKNTATDDGKKRKQPPPHNKAQKKRPSNQDVVVLDDDANAQQNTAAGSLVVDLTSSDAEEESATVLPQQIVSNDATSWTCPKCTLVNAFPVLVCLACRFAQSNNENLVQEVQHRENRNGVQQHEEVRASERDFDGFNIYGTTKQASGKMNHMT